MKSFTDPLRELEECLIQINSTTMGRRAFLAAMPLLLASCATPKTRYREGDNQGQYTDLSVEDEKQMTKDVLPQMKKDYPPLKDNHLQSYISDLGQKLVQANNLHNKPYTYSFSVVDVGYINAFALPAGTVFVTAPLIAMAETEAELMGVIGHEVGHIQARHTAERMHAAKKAQSKSWLYGVGGGLAGAALGLGVGKLTCRKNDRQCLQKAAELGAVAGVGGGLLIQKYAFMANSREDEMEADRIGFRTALKSGYDKNKIGLFYEKLYEMEQKSKKSQGVNPILASLSDAMSTHPPSLERIKQMRQMSNESVNPAKALVSSSDFAKMRSLAAKYAKKK